VPTQPVTVNGVGGVPSPDPTGGGDAESSPQLLGVSDGEGRSCGSCHRSTPPVAWRGLLPFFGNDQRRSSNAPSAL